MVNTCVAVGCTNGSKLGLAISLHAFPRDPARRKEWIARIKRDKLPKSESSLVLCSEHFEPDCFEDISFLQRTVLGKHRRRLKPDAVPTIFHLTSQKHICEHIVERAKKRERPERIENHNTTEEGGDTLLTKDVTLVLDKCILENSCHFISGQSKSTESSRRKSSRRCKYTTYSLLSNGNLDSSGRKKRMKTDLFCKQKRHEVEDKALQVCLMTTPCHDSPTKDILIKLEPFDITENNLLAVSETLSSGEVIPKIKVEPFDTTDGDFPALVAALPSTQIENNSNLFWSIPALIKDEDYKPPPYERVSDSDGFEADEFFLVLDEIYPYTADTCMEELVLSLAPRFLERLYLLLKCAQLPTNWAVLKQNNFIQIIRLTETLCPVIQKLVAVDGNRKIYFFVHNQEIPTLDRTWIRSIPKLQMSQKLKNSFSEIIKYTFLFFTSAVCCGNFEEEYLVARELNKKAQTTDALISSAYIEHDFQEIASDGTKYSQTLRAKECALLLNSGLRCGKCSELRGALVSMKPSDIS